MGQQTRFRDEMARIMPKLPKIGCDARLKTHMTWKPIPNSAKSLLEGVEFGMTNGATTCRCFISQREIDRWEANHIGKIDRHIAFELFRRHESEIYAAAARILYETPYVEMTITAEDRRP
jgi:hypothetical protein